MDLKNVGNIDKRSKKVGFSTDVYDVLDSLFHEPSEELVIRLRNKYHGYGAIQFLEDMNYTNLSEEEDVRNEPLLVVSMVDSNFRFTDDHMEEFITMELPYDWDELEKTVRDYVSENPVAKKVEKNDFNELSETSPMVDNNTTSSGVDGEWVKALQEKFGMSEEEATKVILNQQKQKTFKDNVTLYTSKGNPDMKLKSGMYNHIVHLVRSNGWEDEFVKMYGSKVQPFVNKSKDPDVEKSLLIGLGFEYMLDKIKFDESEYWNNKIIEVDYLREEDNN